MAAVTLREWIVLRLSRSREECLMHIADGACEYGRTRRIGYTYHWKVWCERYRTWCNMGLDSSKACLGGFRDDG